MAALPQMMQRRLGAAAPTTRSATIAARPLALEPCRASRKKGGGSKTTSTSTPAADTPAEPIAPPPRPTEQGRVLREWRSLGGRVIEADGAIPGSQGEDQPDFWEGEKFEGLGKAVERYFLPALLALGLLCGGIAAKTYDSGADVYIKSPTSPDSEASVLLAGPQ